MASSVVRRLTGALQRHGWPTFFYLVAYNVYYFVRHRGRFRPEDPDGQAFDRTYGVETTEIREIGSLDIDPQIARHGIRYQPSSRDVFDEALAVCSIEFSRYHFIDFGCGKGRAMLFASDYPFAAVVGVEFSHELCAVARRNMERYRNTRQRCHDLRVVHDDATRFELPREPLVCYFNNPFDDVIMGQVVQNLERSLDVVPRDVVVIYVEPRFRSPFATSPRWHCVTECRRFVVYRAGRARR